MIRLSLSALGALACLSGFATAAAANDADMWAALAQGGKVIILRHASAPGPEQGREGDPPGFRLDDCSTQRNLSDYGRDQAVKMGEALRAHNVVVTKVMVSPWCRTLDTARLMNLGAPLETTTLLRNVGEQTAGAGAANRSMPNLKALVRQLHEIIQAWNGPGTLVMVSHGRTVTAVVFGDRRHSPEQAAMYVLQPLPGGKAPFREIGSLSPPGGSAK